MNIYFYACIEAAALSMALSADALASGFSYGAARVKIPFFSALVIGLVGSFVLMLSLIGGSLAAPYLPQSLTKYFAFAVLAALGLYKLSGIGSGAALADLNRDKILSVAEAALLSVALSLDSFAAGFSAGMGAVNLFAAVLLTLLFTTAAIFLGAKSGRKLSASFSRNARFFGLILVILAVTKIL